MREPKEKKVSLQVDVFVKDGEVDEVKQSAHLGTQVMLRNEDEDVYECVGVYSRPGSKVDCSFDLIDLGEVTPKTQIVEGMHEIDVRFNALFLIDEQEKLDALSDEERETLADIGIMELQAIGVEAHEDDKPGWTPLQNAVIAILQHEGLPKPIMAHNTVEVTGNHTDGSDALLVVGDHEFEAGGKFWAFCEYKECEDKRNLYRFTWMGVPESVLNEQE
jgi:hypothetical protein